MYRNDRHNIRARYETLYDVNLKDEVWDVEKNEYVKLEEVLVKVTSDKDPLFLAVEQGAGKLKKDVNVVINPHTRVKSRAWLNKEYPRLILKETRIMHTSVIIKKPSINNQYKERLQEFLCPTLQYAVENQNKKIGKNLKTYAQAVGVKVSQIEKNDTIGEQMKNNNNNQSKNRNQSSKNRRIQGLEDTIQHLEKQVTQLKEVIEVLYSKIIEDEKFKLAIGTKLDEIIIPTKENTIEIDENESDNEEVQYPKQKQVM